MIQIPNYRELVDSFTHIPIAFQNKINIGDNIQSVAARDLWGVTEPCSRNQPSEWTDDMVVPMHGWYGGSICQSDARCILLGIHLDYRARIKVMQNKPLRSWFRAMVREQGFPVLARDTSTRDFFRSVHVESEFGGCISQTLAPYDGPREGILNVDRMWVSEGSKVEQTYTTPAGRPYDTLMSEAEARIAAISRAELVHTNRLHIALPCQALGTPFQLHRIMQTFEPHRFSGLAYAVEPRRYDLNLRNYPLDE